MSEIIVFIANFSEGWSVLNEAAQNPPVLKIKNLGSKIEDHEEELIQSKGGIILFGLKEKANVVNLAQIVKWTNAKPELCFKIAILDFLQSKQIEKVLLKLGINEFLEPSLKARALRYKIDLWSKSLVSQLNTKKHEEKNELKKLEVDCEKDSIFGEKTIEPSVSFVTSDSINDDIWLYKNTQSIKKVLGKWIVRLEGPSPYVCQWEEDETKRGHFKLSFKKSAKKTFTPEGGEWTYIGDQKPDFDWKENQWIFTGKDLKLQYQNEDFQSFKFILYQADHRVQENSRAAERKKELIEQSLNPEITMSKDQVNTDNLEGKNKTDNIKKKNLSGAATNEKINQGHLSGRVGNEQYSGGNNLSLDNSNSNLSNQAGDFHLERENINQKGHELSNDKYKESALLDMDHSTEKIKTHWKDKNYYEQPKTGKILSFEREKIAPEALADDPEVVTETPIIIAFILKNSKKYNVKIEDFFDSILVVRLPELNFFTEDQVFFDCTYTYQKVSTQLQAQVLVEELIEDDEGNYLNLKVSPSDLGGFKKLIDFYQARQGHVDIFLNKAKG